MEHNEFRKSTEDEEEHVTNFENPSKKCLLMHHAMTLTNI